MKSDFDAGGQPWEYQSCTPTATEHASMGGFFSFTANRESGRPSFFDAKVKNVKLLCHADLNRISLVKGNVVSQNF